MSRPEEFEGGSNEGRSCGPNIEDHFDGNLSHWRHDSSDPSNITCKKCGEKRPIDRHNMNAIGQDPEPRKEQRPLPPPGAGI